MITASPAGPMNFPRLDRPYTKPKPLSGSNDPTAYKSVTRRSVPNGELPSDPQQTDRRHPTRHEAMQKARLACPSSLRVLRRQGAAKYTSLQRRVRCELGADDLGSSGSGVSRRFREAACGDLREP